MGKEKLNSVLPVLATLGCIGVVASTSILSSPGIIAGGVGLAGSIAFDLIKSVAENVLPDQLKGITPKRLRGFYSTPVMDISNHDLFRALKHSIIEGIKNTELQFRKKNKAIKYEKGNSTFIKELVKDLEENFEIVFEHRVTDKEIIAFEEQRDNSLYTKLENYIKLNYDEGATEIFIEFFKKQLPLNIIDAYSEILKEDNRVWVAYQRLLTADILESSKRNEDSLSLIISELQAFKKQLDLIEDSAEVGGKKAFDLLWSSMEDLQALQKKSIIHLDTIQERIADQIEYYSEEILNKIDRVSESVSEVKDDLGFIKKDIKKLIDKEINLGHESLEELEQRILIPYLQYMVDTYGSISLPMVNKSKNKTTIPLEKVFVSLRLTDKQTRNDFKAGSELIKLKIKEREALLGRKLTGSELSILRSEIIQDSPTIYSFRKGTGLKEGEVALNASLNELFNKERFLLILGDPGSGKSTLIKWLAVQLVNSHLNENSKNALSIGLENTENYLPENRIPILIKIPEYSANWTKHEQNVKVETKNKELINFIGYHLPTIKGVDKKDLHRLLKHYISENKAVVLLDGMDEIVDIREKIIDEIETFKSDWIEGHLNTEYEDHLPGLSRGNQLIITSRIVGYHAEPLQSDIAQVYINDMDKEAISEFCKLWIKHASDDEDTSEYALEEAIFDDSKPRVRELATNPLLITILGILFIENEKELPKSRVGLYEESINIFIKKWKANKRYDIDLLDIEFDYLLCTLAEKIHSSPSEDIIEDDLRTLFANELKNLKGTTALQSEETANHLIEILKMDVGLISERGNNLFHFIHRTFQEYLAGKKLVRIREQATRNIIEKITDPIWREPVLLAIAHADIHWSVGNFNSFINDLINEEDQLKDLIPRSLLLIAKTLPDLTKLTEETMFTIVQEIFLALSRKDSIGGYRSIRETLKEVISNFLKGSLVDIFYKSCEKLLKENPYLDHHWELLRLSGEDNWYKKTWIAFLIDKYESDSPEFDYPIDLILHKYCSRDETDHEIQGLLMRNALLKKPELLKTIKEDIHLINLMTVLYGGWKFQIGAENLRRSTKQQYLKYLKEDSFGLKKISPSEGHSLDFVNFIGFEELNSPDFIWDARHIHQKSAFTRTILRNLNKGNDKQELANYFLDVLKNEEDPEIKGQAFLAFQALTAKLVEAGINEILSIQMRKTLSSQLNRLKRWIDSPIAQLNILADKPSKLQQYGWKYLTPIQSSFLWSQMNGLFNQFGFRLHLNFPSGREPVKLLRQNEKELIEDKYEAFVLREAESYGTLFSMYTSDPIYSTAVIFDTLGGRLNLHDYKLMIDALCNVYRTKALQSDYHFGWKIPQFRVALNSDKKKLTYILRLLHGVPTAPASVDLLIRYVFGVLWKKIVLHELEGLAFTLFLNRKISSDVINLLSDRFQQTDLLLGILKAVNKEKDDYVKFLIFYYLGNYVIIQNEEYVKLLRKIQNPLKWAICYDLLKSKDTGYYNAVFGIELINQKQKGIEDDEELSMEIVEKLNSTKNAYEKSMIGLILAKESELNQQQAIIHKALGMALSIESEDEMFFLLFQVQKYYPTFFNSFSNLKELFSVIKQDLDIRDLGGFYNTQIIGLARQLINADYITSKEYTHWSILFTGTYVRELKYIINFEEDVDAMLHKINDENSTLQDLKNLLKLLKIKEGVQLNNYSISELLTLYNNGDKVKLQIILPFYSTSSVKDLDHLKVWKDESGFLRDYYHLLCAENGILTPSIFKSLINLEKSGSDRMKIRADIALHGEYPFVSNEELTYKVSSIGKETVYAIAEEMIKEEGTESLLRTKLLWMTDNLLFDDPEIFEQILNDLQSENKPTYNLARNALRLCRNFNTDVKQLMVTYLAQLEADKGSHLWYIIAQTVNLQISNPTRNFPFFSEGELELLFSDAKAFASLKYLETQNEFNDTSEVKKVIQEYIKTKEKDHYHADELLDRLIKVGSLGFSAEKEDFKNNIELLKRYSKVTVYKQSVYEKELREIIELISPNNEIKEALVKSAINFIEEFLIEEVGGALLAILLEIMNEIAAINREQFQLWVDMNKFKKDLIELYKCSNSYLVKKAIIKLISKSENLDRSTFNLIISALKDINIVKDSVVQSIPEYSKLIDMKMLKQIENILQEANAEVAISVVNLVVNISMKSALDYELRKEAVNIISKQLRRQLKDPFSGRETYVLKSHLTNDPPTKNTAAFVYFGDYKDVLYDGLVRLAGFN